MTMNRRKFLESAGLGLAALHMSSLTGCARSVGAGRGERQEG
jgi:hypothetical protein